MATNLKASDKDADMYHLSMSEEAEPLLAAVKKFCAEEVAPIADQFYKLGEGRKDRWSWAPGQLELLDKAKNKAKKQGLWNFFLPDAETGEGLKNLDYAYIAAELGRQPLASECLNCSAPDTGNMEVLERVGTPEQKEKWLKPLLDRRDPLVLRHDRAATSPRRDAKNIGTRAVLDGDEWVINGEKYYISGAGDPRCKIMICMVKTSPEHRRIASSRRSSCRWTRPGLEDPRADDGVRPRRCAARPHAHQLDNVRVPKENILLGEGRGFEISQVRLGPGRIHHCMRSIGQAERALDLMIKRGDVARSVRQAASSSSARTSRSCRARASTSRRCG